MKHIRPKGGWVRKNNCHFQKQNLEGNPYSHYRYKHKQYREYNLAPALTINESVA